MLVLNWLFVQYVGGQYVVVTSSLTSNGLLGHYDFRLVLFTMLL